MPAKAKLTTRQETTSQVAADNLAKGSELTFAEGDSNFINLRDQTFAISDGSTTTDISAGETITFSGASVSGNTVSITGGGGGSANLGNLQVNDTTLSPITTNDDLNLSTNGSGDVIVSGIGIDLEGAVRLGSATQDADIRNYNVGKKLTIGSINGQTGAQTQYQSDGSMRTILADTTKAFNIYTQSTPTGALAITTASTGPVLQANSTFGSSDQNITITPSGTGNIVLDGLNWPTSDGSVDQVLKTDGAGNLSFTTIATTSTGDITFTGNNISTTSSNADLELAAAGTGTIRIVNDTITMGDGSGNCLLTTSTDNVLHIGVNQTQTDVSAPESATEGHLRFLTNGNIVMRPAGDDYIYGQCDRLILGKTTAPVYDADSLISSAGRGDLTLTSNGYNNSWEPRIVLYAPGAGSTDAAKSEGVLALEAGDFADLELTTSNDGRIDITTATSTTIGANGAASALTANPVGYIKIKVSGTEYQIPYYNT